MLEVQQISGIGLKIETKFYGTRQIYFTKVQNLKIISVGLNFQKRNTKLQGSERLIQRPKRLTLMMCNSRESCTIITKASGKKGIPIQYKMSRNKEEEDRKGNNKE
ncbi:hypothetical protein AAHA92_10418 [Salvia divinorum]|uniref:Uncharacterized protein n=1 Tax=Salvia divinorum TaxID=28513 RepID=A0ABD1HUP4_SALDI